MQRKNFTLKNWNYSFFNSENFKALISVAAIPAQNDNVSYLYCPTVIDEDNNEIFQTEFESLLKAIDFINSKYGHWAFVDPTVNSSDDGCGSCNAH
jgi:hypothetical protein